MNDTATALIVLTVGAGITVTVAATIALFYAGRWLAWMVRR